MASDKIFLKKSRNRLQFTILLYNFVTSKEKNE
jgi:hypothetical protein